ncbi:cytochrome P450 6B5-like [Cydia pomonella]|uniref:cytochrome P450 6B5-like n=1 Tax=Cydia pomonella TaxID=82600 RepID=UPI002ADD491F|nr:cytochrome P450 6B5-like [Cydia pomonella]
MALEIAVAITLGITSFALLVYLYLTRNYSYWKKRGIAGPEPVPVFGNLKDTALRRTTFNELFKHFYDSYPKSKVVGIYRAWHPSIVVRDLDVLKHVMIREFDNFSDRGFSFSNKGLGFNLFNAESDDWRVLRTRLSPMFTTGKLKNMLYLITERADKFLDFLGPVVEKSPEQNVHTLVQRFTIGNIGACAFGIDIDINDVDNVFETLDNLIFTTNYTIELETMYPGILKKFDMSFWPKAIKDFFYGLVNDILRERNGQASNRKDFMDLMLELRNAGEIHGVKRHEDDKDRKLQITDDVMAAQAFVFYAAGYETSATTMGFLLHELALHPEIQGRVVAEINQVLKKHGEKITYDCIKDMAYLEQVFDETLRMYPVVDPIPRLAMGRVELPDTGVTVEKGMGVLVSVSGIHYDPKYWSNPTEFNPDRFSSENSKDRHPCAFLPFGLGPRNCIGMRFAQVQSKVCLVKLLQRYRVEPCAHTRSQLEFDPDRFVLRSKHGLPLKVVPRTHQATLFGGD